MDLLRVTDEATAARWVAVNVAVHDHDFVGLPADPLPDVWGKVTATGAHGTSSEFYLGVEDGVDVALAEIEMPTRDNLVEAELTVSVVPGARRRGLARHMLGRALDRCREVNRTRVVVLVPGALDGTPSPSECFARSAGFALKLRDTRRVLDLDAVEDAELARLAAGARTHAPGYELLSWVDRAPTHVHEGLAQLAGRMSLDAPQGDLEHDPEVWDAARWRAEEADTIARGRVRVGTLALCGDEVVAYTDIGVAVTQPVVGYQWNTIVRGDHRGHRLGLLLKATNLALLRNRSPDTRWLNTWNATSNSYMVSINETLGYRPVDSWGEWQREL